MADGSDLRKRDRTMGLSIVGVAFVAALCISWWARGVVAPVSSAPRPATTEGVVGFPRAVDVVATLDAAESLTERKELHGIAAWGVKSDGTVDSTQPGNRIRYVFMSARGQGPQPPRPPGTLPKRDSCGRQNVHVKETGIVADPDQPSYPCLAERAEALPTPRCGPKEVWKVALEHGFRPEERAHIEYYRSTVGPAWRFDVPGTHRTMVLYGDCGRELMGAEVTGSVP